MTLMLRLPASSKGSLKKTCVPSSFGKGAKFTVRLPRPAVLATTPLGGTQVLRRALAPSTLPSLPGMRVLVVDDETDARDAIAIVLEQCGAAVTAVASVADAMRAIEASVPEILVSDIGMPMEDGYTLIRTLRALPAAKGGATPALALTAFASASDEKRIRDAGFQGFLAKPVAATELADAVATIVRAGTAKR